jgi:hypothetical protein
VPKQLHSLLHSADFTANSLISPNKSTGGLSVNPQVAGSSPARGASIYKGLGPIGPFLFGDVATMLPQLPRNSAVQRSNWTRSIAVTRLGKSVVVVLQELGRMG